jgi:hypothetical protein
VKSRRLCLICLWSGLLMLAAVLGWLVYRADLVSHRLDAIDGHLAALQGNLDQPFGQALVREHLVGLQGEIDGLAGDAAPFVAVTPYLRWVPAYGGDLAAAPALLRLADRLARAATIMADILQPMDADAGLESLPAVAQSLAAHQTDLSMVEALLLDAQAIRPSIDRDSLSPSLAKRLDLVDVALPRLRQALPLLRQMPDMLGVYCPRTYLILAQNQDELRPTGGYITAAGHLVLDRGRIVTFEMRDSYAVDDLSLPYPRPPLPLYTIMGADLWLLRDANWSPDFPTSARQAAELYWLGQRVAVDGVIAVDQAALPLLLKGLGSVEVSTSAGVDTVTAENVIKLLRLRWAPAPGQNLSGEWWKQRKSFMVSLGQAALERLRGGGQATNTEMEPLLLAQGLDQALREKHILLSSDHAAWAQALATLGWDGALRAQPGDLLAVIDANVGFTKASAVVERQTDYQVSLGQDGSAAAYVSLVYHHTSQKAIAACQITPRYDPVYTDMMDCCYWDYVRLVVPKGATLRSAPHIVVPAEAMLRGQATTGQVDTEELPTGVLAWGQLFLLAPGETAALDFAYELPAGTAARQADGGWLYRLRLPKQPGTDRRPWQVTVRLPEGARLSRSTPAATAQDGAALVYRLAQDTDQEIVVQYRLGGGS